MSKPPFLLVTPDEAGLLLSFDCLLTGLVLRGGLGVLISSNSFTFTPGGIGNLVKFFGLAVVKVLDFAVAVDCVCCRGVQTNLLFITFEWKANNILTYLLIVNFQLLSCQINCCTVHSFLITMKKIIPINLNNVDNVSKSLYRMLCCY